MTLRGITFLPLVLLSVSPALAQSPLAARLADLRQATSVRLALTENAEMRAYNVSVEAAEGIVVLSGLVPTLGTRDRVVAFVNGLPNVRVVRSTLRLEGQPDQPLSDPAMSTRIEEETVVDDVRVEEPVLRSTDAEQTGLQYHTVQRGDTLYGIARRYETSVSAISDLNNLSSTTVRIGQRLRVK